MVGGAPEAGGGAPTIGGGALTFTGGAPTGSGVPTLAMLPVGGVASCKVPLL